MTANCTRAIAAQTIVPMRVRPSAGTTLDDELLYGMTAEILEEVPDETEGERIPWLRIRTHYGYEGYCKKEDVLLDERRADVWEKKHFCTVMQPFADVLTEPKVQGVCMESVTRGGRLAVCGEPADGEGWLLVELADGRRGYTKETFLGPYYDKPFTDNEAEFRERLVEVSKGYLGVQYRWGGKSTLGIDCSGLTSMCYMLCGVFIWRNAGFDRMENFGVHEVSFDRKKPGDMLFFPGHIALYIGEDRYIHSTGKNGSDGVVINSLNPAHGDFRQDLAEKLERVGSIF